MDAKSGDVLFSYSTNQVPIFNGEHCDYWSSQLMTIFISQDLWDLIEDGFQDPPGTRNSSWTDENQKEYKEKLKKNATALSLSILESLVLKRQKMHGRFCKRSFKAQIKPSLLSFKICGETLII